MIAERIHSIAAPDANADRAEAVRFTRHLVSLFATKTADGLINPKLVLAWLMSSLGAPGALIGVLVPVREAGALLPQLALARWIEARRQRKWVWTAGSAMQGVAALGIAVAALTLNGVAAGWAIVGCLAVLAVARSACSASYKDILARTVDKGTRGTVSGSAGTVAAAVVLAFALALSTGTIPRSVSAVSIVVAVAGLLWLGAAAFFARLNEPEAEPGRGGDPVEALAEPLRQDEEFRAYIAARALLISTALAPPFLVMLSNSDGNGGPGNLGLLLIASSIAAIVSSYVWGRLSDRSSRRTLMWAGLAAALVLGLAAVIGVLTGGLSGAWAAAGFVLVAQIAYEGARAGRKTHLADMDTDGRKTTYTALSNTMIGVLLFAGGGFGLLADWVGPAWVLACFATMAAMAVPVAARGLSEVQGDG